MLGIMKIFVASEFLHVVFTSSLPFEYSNVLSDFDFNVISIALLGFSTTVKSIAVVELLYRSNTLLLSGRLNAKYRTTESSAPDSRASIRNEPGGMNLEKCAST